MENSLSTIGLVLCSIPLLVHGPEIWSPTLARFVANFWFPPFTFQIPRTPFRPDEALDYSEQIQMIEAALKTVPPHKQDSARDLIFLMLFETRQGSAGFWAAALGAGYAWTLPFEQRHPIHFLLWILSFAMALANANHGYKLPFGKHPFVSKNGWAVGIVFTPFWLAAAYCNWVAFTESRLAAGLETCASKL